MKCIALTFFVGIVVACSHGAAAKGIEAEPTAESEMLLEPVPEEVDLGEALATSPSCDTWDVQSVLSQSRSAVYPRFVVDECGVYGFGADAYGAAPTIGASTYVGKVESSQNLLPPPEDGNDLFHFQLDPDQTRLPQAWEPPVYALFTRDNKDAKDLWTRFKLLPSFGFYYDTGSLNGGFDPAEIELGDPHGAGQTTFLGSGNAAEVPLTTLWDTQATDFSFLSNAQIQVFSEVNNLRDHDGDGNADFRFVQLYGRIWDFDRLTAAAGLSYSLFNVGGALPASLAQENILVGTSQFKDDQQRKQLRIQRSAEATGGWGGGLAVEEPYDDDFTAPSDTTALTRWPSFAGNLVFVGADGVDRIQFSGLVRTLGLETDAGEEHFDTAWGLSAFARLQTVVDAEHREGFYIGVAGGDGVGSYVRGVEESVVFDGTSLVSLEGLGAYIGYKQQWITASDYQVGTNFAYGYAMTDANPGLVASADLDEATNIRLNQAWANVVVFPSSNVAFGFEYQFGRRETIASGNGEDHRFLFIVALSTFAPKAPGARYGERSAAVDAAAEPGSTASLQTF